MLDIVNELDQVVGQELRRVIHEKGLRHRATHILLFNSAQQLFIQKRSNTKDTNPGLWDTSAAGHVDSGESYESCASRELFEELGVQLPPSALRELGRMGPSSDNGFEFVRVYRAESDAQLVLETSEIQDGQWLSIAELNVLIEQDAKRFTTTFIEIWQAFGQS